MTDNSLAGVGVLVTRARRQADEIVAAIEAQNGTAVPFPSIEIVPRDAADIESDLGELPAPEITVFVSPNAVEFGLPYAGNAAIAAIGPATARAVASGGRSVDIRPASGFDSEHLLGEPALQDVDGKAIRIVRAQQGRELLAETLRSRGARVDFLPVYDRLQPRYDAHDIDALEADWRAGKINVVTIMSAESLKNLVAILPESILEMLATTPLVTPAARVIKEAKELLPGVPTTLAQGPQTSDMIVAITELGSNISL